MKATEYLVREHEAILAIMGQLKSATWKLKEGKEVCWASLDEILQFLENFVDRIHHGKEEGILIPALMDHGFPLRGGPMCGYFKGLMMMRDDVEGRLSEVEERLGTQITLPTEAVEITGSPDGDIPVIKEHQLGRKLVGAMRTCLRDPFLWKGSGPGSFADFAHDYLALLDEHIDKENRCLFPMVDDTLTPVEHEKMIRNFEAFDRRVLPVRFQCARDPGP